MAILNFQSPNRVVMNYSTETEGEFEFKPLEPGYGLTIGNALRRVLLSSLEGCAFTSVRIEGIEHEFSTIKGVVEDVTEIVLNLKQVCFKKQIEDEDEEKIHVSLEGKEKVTAGDLGIYINAYQILNPELIICNLYPFVKLEMELTIKKGRGYLPAEENKKSGTPLGTIFIDSIYTPIKNVKYNIENYRLGQKTDYEKLILNISTDGSIHPEEALTEAAEILIHHLTLVSNKKIGLENNRIAKIDNYDEKILHIRRLLKTKLADLDISVRALNCLKAAELETLEELVPYTKNELLKFRNFGKKSLIELDEFLRSKDLHLGMDISKYKLNEK